MWLRRFNEVHMLPLFTPEALAAYLGLTVQTIYNRHSTGGDLPPSFKLGRLLRFHPQDVERWIEMHRSQEQPKAPSKERPPRRRGRPTKAEQIATRRQTLR